MRRKSRGTWGEMQLGAIIDNVLTPEQYARNVKTVPGSDELVEKMRKVARRHGVTIVENRRLARSLYETRIEATVPEAQCAEVARILVWVQAARKRRGPDMAGSAA